MTPTQLAVLRSIHSSVTANGYAPSFREMQKGLGLKSTAYLHGAVEGLISDGFLRRTRGKNRNLEIVKLPPAFGGVCPTCGRAAASGEK